MRVRASCRTASLTVERLALAALALERGVAAAIERERSRFEMQDPIDCFVEEVAVVADHDHRARIARDMSSSHSVAFEIEVVGRLVEEEEIRRGEQRRRQRNPHAPAAGELRTRALLIGVGKAQAGENLGCARRR